MTKAELHWFYGGGAGAFWRAPWKKFTDLIPEDERDDLIAAYSKRLFSGDLMIETRFGRAWAAWENSLASAKSMGRTAESPADYARAFSRIENRYFAELGWLGEDDWIIKNAGKLADIPGHIVHGARDMICPPGASWRLVEAWPRASLKIVPHAGHALSEPGISDALLGIMEDLQTSS